LKVENYRQKIEELNTAVARAERDTVGYRERYSYAANVERMRQELEAREVGSRLSTIGAADSRAEMERALASSRRTAEAAKQTLAALVAERDAFVQAWRAD